MWNVCFVLKIGFVVFVKLVHKISGISYVLSIFHQICRIVLIATKKLLKKHRPLDLQTYLAALCIFDFFFINNAFAICI